MKRKGITEEQYMEEVKNRQDALWFENLRDEGSIVGFSPLGQWAISEVPEKYRYEEYQGYVVNKHFLITVCDIYISEELHSEDKISLNADLVETINIYSERLQPEDTKVIVMWKNYAGRSIKQFHVHILWIGEKR